MDQKTVSDASRNIREQNIAALLKSEQLSGRDRSLLSRSFDVFRKNLVAKEGNTWGNFRGILPSPGQYDGVWNWDSAFHALALSRVDPGLAYEQFEIFFSFQGKNGIFPDVIYADGRILDSYSKPPVLPWAFCKVYERSPRPELLQRAYDCFVKNHGFWDSCRRDEKSGLYYYDAEKTDDRWELHQKWESGMDNSPRWDEGVSQWLCVDLNGYMVLFGEALSRMASWLNLKEDAKKWEKRAEDLKKRANELLWNEEIGCFADRDRFTGAFSPVLSSVAFVSLFAGYADTEKAGIMARNAEDPRLFYPAMPTVAYNCPAFCASDYWRGPVWLNIGYFSSEGLRRYGYTEIADRLREHMLNDADADKSDIYEYYDARTGKGLGASCFGWSAAFIIEMICEKQ